MKNQSLQILFLALSLFGATSLFAQNIVDFCPEVPTGPFSSGATIEVPVIATGIQEISGAQLFLSFDDSAVSFTSGTGVEADDMSFNSLSPGQVRSVYFDEGTQGVTYPNGTAFFTLTFTANQDIPSLEIDLLSSVGGDPIEAVGSNGIALPVSYCGVVISDGGPSDVLELCASLSGELPVDPGEVVSGAAAFWSGFTNVTSFSYIVFFDESRLDFEGWGADATLEPNILIVAEQPGEIHVSWNSDGPPVSLPGGAGIIQFNFTATGNIEDFSDILNISSANVVYNFDQPGTVQVCDGATFDPTNFVDFCPDNPSGPFSTGGTIEVPVRVKNFVGMVHSGVPLRFDMENFEYTNATYDLPSDIASMTIEELADGGLRVTVVDWEANGISLADNEVLFTLHFTALQAVDAIDVIIDPSVGDFFASRDLNLNLQHPVTACDEYYLGLVRANVKVDVYRDETDNCSGTPTGEPLLNWIAAFTNTASGVQHTAVSGPDGNAYLALPNGDYTYEWIAPGTPELWDNCQAMPYTVTDDTNFDDAESHTVNALVECSETAVSISSFNLRPCFTNNTFIVTYYNQGTAVAEDAYIDVTFDQAYTPLSSSLPYTDEGGGIYRFQLGDLVPNASGTIQVVGAIDCDYPVGATLCASAVIYPYKSDCNFNNPAFAGGELEVISQCDGDSVRFHVKNIGEGPTGEVSLTIIEDVVIYMNTTVNLEVDETTSFSILASGRTYRMEAALPEFAPYISQGLDVNEACGTLPGGGFSMGMVNGFSLLDGDPWIDRYCLETSAAYDPNDKQASPAGVGEANYIFPNQRMDYKIRFQNTGTDTAFTVVIRDTIDTEVLDISSIRAGASSHPYRLNVDENVMTFTFENILLVDSLTNEPASHGFVHFGINQQADLEDGTVVENKAAIYFDYNDPIITEPSRQTIGREFLTSRVVNFQANAAAVPVYPSPTNGPLHIDLAAHSQTTEVIVYDIFGRQLLQRQLAGNSQHRLDLSTLSSGRYAYRLLQAGQLIQTGVVAKQ